MSIMYYNIYYLIDIYIEKEYTTALSKYNALY